MSNSQPHFAPYNLPHIMDLLQITEVYTWVLPFPTLLTTSVEKHDEEEKHLQIGQQRDQSAAAPSVPLMTTWLLRDVTRAAEEAL